MKVTVCQLSAEPEKLENQWQQLVTHTVQNSTELILLPEMPFFPWICSLLPVNPKLWVEGINAHNFWNQKLAELGAQIVIGTRPIVDPETKKRFNSGYLWTTQSGVQDIHRKVYLPNEEGFWEATWYERGDQVFKPFEFSGIIIGFSICTELWFMEHVREYGKQGIHFLVCPRGTPIETIDKWIAGGRAAAVISGAFCLSSNHQGIAPDERTILGGVGWIIGPEGNILGTTNEQTPFITLNLDIKLAEDAKSTYPRYILD
ncbi:MAG: carbon-nitrogen hydrolase family protein [Promethearchaeota archaeon]